MQLTIYFFTYSRGGVVKNVSGGVAFGISIPQCGLSGSVLYRRRTGLNLRQERG